jgi:NAD(P)H-flavin reductase
MPTVTACNPADAWLALPTVIREVLPETPGVATYQLRLVEENAAVRYRFRPGQFNMLYLPGIGEVAISISGDPADSSCLPHTIRQAGLVTNALARLGPQATIGLRGPFGTSWPMEQCAGKDVVLVAGGIGLAPLRPVVYELLADRRRFGAASLVYGARTADDLLFTRQFDDWAANGLAVETTVDWANVHWKGRVGVVTLLLECLALPRPEETVLLVCGPEVMMWYAVQTALTRGLNPANIWMSLERNMNCAVGLCGHCQFGPTFICKDGPVFRYDRIAPFLTVEDL